MPTHPKCADGCASEVNKHSKNELFEGKCAKGCASDVKDVKP